MDPTATITIFSTLGGAIGSLFLLYSLFLRNRIDRLEKDNEALEKENKRLTAMIITAAESSEGVQEMRRQLGQFLRGDL